MSYNRGKPGEYLQQSEESNASKLNINQLNRPDYRYKSLELAVQSANAIETTESQESCEKHAEAILVIAEKYFEYLHRKGSKARSARDS